LELAQDLILLLIAVALLAWGARAIGVAYPIVLVIGGIVLAFIPGLADVELDPELVFLIFLPPLVHAAAYRTGTKRLRDNAPEITVLAVGLVGATIVTVAVVAHALVPGLTWPAAVALGAIVAPTDPVAATSVFRRAGAPERVEGVVEGESLVNDATGLVVLRIAIAAAVSGSFSAWNGVGDLILVAAGGFAVGVAGAMISGWLRSRLDDSLIEITITLLTPYAVYVAAEKLHVSGVLAAVTSGAVLGSRDHRLSSAGTRLEAYAFWGVLTFLLESSLFVLVGLQVRTVFQDLPISTGVLIAAGAAITAAVVVTRLLIALGLWRLSLRERAVVGWSGMRGAVSLAAALSIPLTTDLGTGFPQRGVIICLTLIVIGATLVGQGLTLPWLVSWVLPPDPTEPGARAHAMARFDSVTAALDQISDLSAHGDVAPSLIERARELYSSRAGQLAGECRLGVAEADSDTDAWLALRLELLQVERQSLVEARDQGEIANAVVLSVERDLDLEEERLQARRSTEAAAGVG
jgi:CPA1 family monovalent cation:H+ antiporter